MKGSSLAVWEVIMVALDYNMDEQKVAKHFQRPMEWVRAAFHYNEAYPEEICLAISDNHAMNARGTEAHFTSIRAHRGSQRD